MKVRIIKSGPYTFEGVNTFEGYFCTQGWAQEVEIVEGRGAIIHGHRSTSVDVGGTYVLHTDNVNEALELRYVQFLDGSASEPCEIAA